MAMDSWRRVKMDLSTLAACSPGGDVRSWIPREPNGPASEIFIFSQSPWRTETRWLLALYVEVISWRRDLKTAWVVLDVAPMTERWPENSSTRMIS